MKTNLSCKMGGNSHNDFIYKPYQQTETDIHESSTVPRHTQETNIYRKQTTERFYDLYHRYMTRVLVRV